MNLQLSQNKKKFLKEGVELELSLKQKGEESGQGTALLQNCDVKDDRLKEGGCSQHLHPNLTSPLSQGQ